VIALRLGDSSKILSDRWRSLSDEAKAPFDISANEAMAAYLVDKEAYNLKLATFKATQHETPAAAAPASHGFAFEQGSAMKVDLFNKVVRLKPGAMTEGSEFSYWYVVVYANQAGLGNDSLFLTYCFLPAVCIFRFILTFHTRLEMVSPYSNDLSRQKALGHPLLSARVLYDELNGLDLSLPVQRHLHLPRVSIIFLLKRVQLHALDGAQHRHTWVNRPCSVHRLRQKLQSEAMLESLL
jgi:hypothetical protein